MGLYNLSEFITTIKEDVGIKDLPLPVTDNELIDRFDRSALRDFSVIYPKVAKCMINDDNLVKQMNDTMHSYYTYQIPKFVYDGTIILDVSNFDVARPNGYVPSAYYSSPDVIIESIACMRMEAGLSSVIANVPTYEFEKPDILRVYNGWSSDIYEVELLLKHDLSLSTIPDGALMDLRDLATLDMKSYLYNKLKRKDQLDVGVGNIQLHIDDWSNAENDRRELLKQWREEGANLDFDHIKYF